MGSNGTVWGVDNNNSVIKYAEERLKKLYEKEMLSQRLTLTPADVLGGEPIIDTHYPLLSNGNAIGIATCFISYACAWPYFSPQG